METEIIKPKISPQKWKPLNVVSIGLFHIISFYALFTVPQIAKYQSILFVYFLSQIAGFGVTGGVHRLWCHRSYKANTPLRIILATCFSIAGQNTIFDWVRDHRVHHKYTETDADPHNSRRGFFFSHVGWLLMTKHPEVLLKGRAMMMDDVVNDPVVYYHTKFFKILKFLLCFFIPCCIPIYFWGETVYISIMSQIFIRYPLTLNITWLVNSAAHMWGTKPFDKRIMPVENRIVALLALGEGWHNYHHVFPWDYKTAELGKYAFNYTTMLLDFFASIGWAYDLKEPSKELIARVVEKTGDGSER